MTTKTKFFTVFSILSLYLITHCAILLENSSAQNKELNELLALSYLQGYEPASDHKNVVLYDREKSYQGLNFLVSTNAPMAYLMDMKGQILHSWSYSADEIPEFGQGKNSTNFWCNAYLFGNGDVLALYTTVGIIKIDKNSRLLWSYKINGH